MMTMAETTKLGKLCKERMLKEILDSFRSHPDFIITAYMGSSVADLELLRRNLKKSSADYMVVKNSILKIAFENMKLAEEAKTIESGMGISFSGQDIISTCKTVVNFAKDHNKFKIKGAIIDGRSVTADKVKQLAALPSRQVLLTQVVVGMKSPITGFVNVLSGTLRKFVYCIDAIKTKKNTEHPTGA
jgi:large subunit ribosomal protein L10